MKKKTIEKIANKVFITNSPQVECSCGEKVVIHNALREVNPGLICKHVRFGECICGNVFIRSIEW